ncbi:MAG: DUF4282 domain-containing protein [Micavibrio sp.]
MNDETQQTVIKDSTDDKQGLVRSVFFFDSMITPKIITILYWLFLAGVVISALGIMFGSFIAGLLTLVFGAIGARIWCELMMVLFKINENIQKIADRS